MSLLNEVLKDLDSQDAKNPDQELLRQYASPTVAASSGGIRTRIKQIAVLMLCVAGVVLLALGVKSWLGGRTGPVLPAQPVADAGQQVQVASVQANLDSSPASVPRVSSAASTSQQDGEQAGDAAPQGEPESGALAVKSAPKAPVAAQGDLAETAVEINPARKSVTVKPVAMLPRFSASKSVTVAPASAAPKPPAPAPTRVVRAEPIVSSQSTPSATTTSRASRTSLAPKPEASFRERPSLQSIQPPPSTAVAPRRSITKPSLKRLYELDLAERAEALRLVGVGDLSGAESRLRRFVTANPEAKLSRSTLASVLIQQNRPVEAEQILIGGMAQDEEGMGRVKLLARTHIARKDFDAAKRILDANPVSIDRDPEYHSLRAAVYQRTGDYNAAASTYRQLLNDYPPQPAWWLGLALSLEAAGRRKEAIYAYRQVRDFQTAKPALKAYASERIFAMTR